MKLKRKAEEEAPWEEYEERFNELPDDLDELRGKIENNKAALECFRGDRSIRELYERVCAEIQDDEAHLADLESFVTHGEDKINGIKVRLMEWGRGDIALILIICWFVSNCIRGMACQAEGSGVSHRFLVQGVFHGHWMCR